MKGGYGSFPTSGESTGHLDTSEVLESSEVGRNREISRSAQAGSAGS